MKNLYFLITFLCTSILTLSVNAQTTIGFEDFDGNEVNLTSASNISDFGSGGGTGGDVFGRVNGQAGGVGMPFDVADDTAFDVSGGGAGSSFPADENGIAGQNTTAFFALNDMDAVAVNDATLIFSGWGSATISDIQIDLAAMGDFESSSSDGFIIEAAVDGGTFQEVFRAETNEAATKTYRPLDGGFVPNENDPLELFIDGATTTSAGFLDKCDATTGDFDTYTSSLLNGQTASEVQIRIRWEGTPSGSEPMGIDNITVNGTVSGSSSTPIITEIMYNAASSEPAWEWIEVYNPGSTTIDLSGYVIDDNNGVAHSSANIASGSIAAGQSSILYNADNVTAADFMEAWGTVALIAVTDWSAMSLNNGGDTIGIWDSFASYSGDNAAQLNVIEQVAYDDSGAWPSDDGAGSIFLNDLSADNTDGSNWTLSTDGATTPLFNAYTSMALGGNSGNDIGSPDTIGATGVLPLLISEIVVTPTEGEFIEIYNPNPTALDLSDVYLTDATFASGGAYYYNIVTGANAGGGGFGDFLARFPDGAMIAAQSYQTVSLAGSDNYFLTYSENPDYELYEDGATADAILDMREGLPGAINNQGGLTNGGEVAVLFYWDGTTDLVSDLDYVVWGDKEEAVDKTGVAIDGPDADANTSIYQDDTQIANQEVVSASGHPNDQSFQREDLTEGAETATGGNGVNGNDETSEDLMNTWCTSTSTPGVLNNCGVVPPTGVSLISEVQGDGPIAALENQTVTVEAIVIGDYQADDQLDGFFIQEEDLDADADDNTSEGIFVFCDTCADDVAVGDLVEITGLAVEFFGMTQIDVTQAGSSITVVSQGNTLPTEVTISLPASGSTEAEATFENVEGMLINFSTELVVSEYFELARYGTLVLSAEDRPRQFTDENEPDVAGYTNFLDNLNQTRIILDDDTNIQNDATTVGPDEPYFWPRPGLSNTNLIRGGDRITNLKGVMHWSFSGQSGTDAWRIRPVLSEFSYDFTEANPRPANPDNVGGNFKVASFNVLNYFTTLDSRGANSNAELDRQREKIAAAICNMDADIVGLIEIENNGTTALNDLLNGTNGINATCSDTYAAIDTGMIGSDEIAVAFIYNTATVSPEGAFAILDSSVDPRFIDTKNRPALAQSFTETATGATLTVVVNHLKSKGSDCNSIGDPDLNDGSGNCNITRTEAASAMVDWLAGDPTNSGDPDYLIIGDLNSYSNETPIDAIKQGSDDTVGTGDDFTDLADFYLGGSAYSFVFDGQLGYLDYALASSSLLPQLTGTTIWNINADEVNVFDYNDDIQDSGESSFQRESNALPIYEPNAFRASDHDPVLIGMSLADANNPPVITCPTNINIDSDTGLCGAIVNFTDPTVTDPDGDLDTVVQTAGLPSGSEFPIGISTVEFTATDLNGNMVDCSFTIEVTDAEAPQAVCADITIQLDDAGNAMLTPADLDGGSTDNCGVASVTASKIRFDCTDIGENMVTLTVTDVNGNESNCVAEVTVEDVTPPETICADMTLQLDDMGHATLTAADINGGSTDNCGVASVTVSQTDFDCTDVGVNMITLIATDVNGNESSCMAQVTVEDVTPPEIVCMDVTVELGSDGTTTLVPEDLIASDSDICGLNTLSVDVTEVTCADIGAPVSVTVTATDQSGNTAECTSLVTVVDTMAPVVTCPGDIIVNQEAGILYEVPDYLATGEVTVIDNCTDPVSIVTQQPAPGQLLTDGTYTIVFAAEDDFGNVGACTFELTVEGVLGINDFDLEKTVSLYPNPAKNTVIITKQTLTALEKAEIYDVNGRLIKTIPLKNMRKDKNIDLFDITSGVYFVKIYGESSTIVKRLIKE